jgi:antitoxin (DNA-binding transcriptional repressor) of toxin-antitoxin stability system
LIRITVSEARKRLSYYLCQCEAGQEFLICRRKEPVAVLRAIPTVQTREPQLGFAKGTFVIPPEFFDPLPEDLLRAFEGRDGIDE